MKLNAYTVTITDLITYTATIVATSPAEAETIAKLTLTSHGNPPEGFTSGERTTQAEAQLPTRQPTQLFETATWYRVKYVLSIPAESEAEAREHFKRFVYDNLALPNLDPAEDHHGEIVVESSCPNYKRGQANA